MYDSYFLQIIEIEVRETYKGKIREECVKFIEFYFEHYRSNVLNQEEYMSHFVLQKIASTPNRGNSVFSGMKARLSLG